MIKKVEPKETFYKGYRFRSRLEARWAVYFDACGLEWEYEKEGFNLSDGTSYLPDFWLPQVEMWAEVKSVEFSDSELKKCIELVKLTGYECILLEGIPDNKAYFFVDKRLIEIGDKEVLNTCIVSMYHRYPKDEHRFYTCLGEIDENGYFSEFCEGDFFNTEKGVLAAKSVRFEFGERK